MPAPPNAQTPAVPSLVPQGPHDGKRPMTLNRLFTLIGSAPSARLYLPSKAVSRCHAVIINADTGFYVRDLASRTRVLVNGEPVREADLHDGDVIQIGPFTFRFTDPGGRRPAPVAPAAGLLLAEGLDEPLRLEDRLVLIGRRETADVSLTENSASSAHAVVIATNGGHVVRDLNSRTGTFVNHVKVHEHVLQPGDTLTVGETTLRYDRARPRAAPAAPADRVPETTGAAPTAESEAAAAEAVATNLASPPALAEPEPRQRPEPDLLPVDREEAAADAETETADAEPSTPADAAPQLPAAAAQDPAEAAPRPTDDEAGDVDPLDHVPVDHVPPHEAPPGQGPQTHGVRASDEPAPDVAAEDGSPESVGEDAAAADAGSSLGVGAYLDSLGGRTNGKSFAEPVAADPAAAPESDSPDDAEPAPMPGREEEDAIPVARDEDLFDDVASRPVPEPGPGLGAAAGPAGRIAPLEWAGQVAPGTGDAPPTVPSPFVPSPEVGRPAAREDGPPRIGLGGSQREPGEPSRTEPSRPPAGGAREASRPSPAPAPPPPVAPATEPNSRPAAQPGRRPWGGGRPAAPPGSSAPRDVGSPAARAARPAPPPPPAPPPAPPAGRRGADAKPPAPPKASRSIKPPPPRPDRPRSPFDLVPGGDPELLEELEPLDESNPGDETRRR